MKKTATFLGIFLTFFLLCGMPCIQAKPISSSKYKSTISGFSYGTWGEKLITVPIAGNTISLNLFRFFDAPIVSVPDANFKAYLVGNTVINTNRDTEIQVSEAEAFAGEIDCSELGIANLTGIEAFVNITALWCADNNLSSLDLSKNTALVELYANSNQLTSLDVSKNTALIKLFVYSNQLANLDVSKSVLLQQLHANNNQLLILDLSKNIALQQLYAYNNQLLSLNLKSGNNNNLAKINVTNNPKLSCIEVDDVAIANSKGTNNWRKDATASYNTVCVAPVVTILDANFKTYLIGNAAINTNGDSEIQVAEAVVFTGEINCANQNIASLTGIEAFVKLKTLRCADNNLSSLDLSKNTVLVELYANNNQLTSLDLSKNTVLVELYANNNQLISLDVSKSTALVELHANNNQLTSLDVSKSTALVELYVNNNQLTSLGVSKNTALIKLYANNNQLTSLDVSKSTALVELYANNNQLTSLDVSKNTALIGLSISSNQLTSLDVSKNITLQYLYVNNNQLLSLNLKNTNNSGLMFMYAQYNSKLSCIQVDDVAVANDKGDWQIDATASYNTVCVAPVVNIPDAIFKAYLVGNTAINTNRDTEIQISEAEAFTGEIGCSELGIANLKGIEAFVNITALWCADNNLSSLDLSKNTALVQLYASSNQLTSLDVSKNPALIKLFVSSNQLASLDVSKCVALQQLYATYNQLTILDLSKNIALQQLYASSNQLLGLNLKSGNNNNLGKIDVTNNSKLSCIEVDDVAIANSKGTNNWRKDAAASYNTVCVAPVVTILDANFKTYLIGNAAINTNGDSEIQVAEAVAFTGEINCANQNIASLTGIEAFVKLKTLRCADNNLSSLDLSKNTTLVELYTNNNQLTSLNVSKSTALIKLYANNNQLTSLDVSKNTDLVELYANNNQFTSLDVSKNTALVELSISSNQLTSLDVSKSTALVKLYAANNRLTSLDVSKNITLQYLYVNNNQLLSLNLKNTNNSGLMYMNAQYNPKLSCIQVDDVAVANGKGDWQIDATASFNTVCVVPVINIPDENFKAYLLGNTAINTNGDNEIQVSEAVAFTGEIDCSYEDIADLTGIEAFVNLETLYCYSNKLTSLDVSKNTALVYLEVFDNELTSLDVSKNTALIELRMWSNRLTNLDVSKNINLESLDCSGNKLTNIDVSKNIALAALDVSHNQLTSLDLSKNTLLAYLYVSNNQLMELDLSKHTALLELDCRNNQMIALNLKNGNNSKLYFMDLLNNPNLSCIQVDNVANANAKVNWKKDVTASYSQNCNYVMPVVLVSYTAKVVANYALLQWQTATEQNNKGFDIYRSTNDGNFVKIGEVPSTVNNGLSTINYTFTDKAPLNGNNYYKLVQVDNDGKENELGVRELNFNLISAVVKVHPNPTENHISVLFPIANFTDLQVTDLNGRVLQRLALKATENSKQVSLGTYPAGIYIIKLSGKAKTESHKILKN